MTKRFIRRFTVALCSLLVLLLGCYLGAVVYGTSMPGTSYVGLPAMSVEERALASELRSDVNYLSVTIGERRAPLPGTLERAQAYIQQQLRHVADPLGLAVDVESLQQTHGNPANLVMTIPGAVPQPIVVIGAHYDSAPGTPGANDNATGVAAALALVRRVAQHKSVSPIRFVFFANEEPPYFQTRAMGSLQHAARCRTRGDDIRVMLSLESMGFYSDEPSSQRYPFPLSLLYPDRGDFIAFVANWSSRAALRRVIHSFRKNTRFPSEGAALPEVLPGVGWSDHWGFWQHGYPALMVTDTAPFRDPHYHTGSDAIGNVDFERLARVVTGLEDVILALAAD